MNNIIINNDCNRNGIKPFVIGFLVLLQLIGAVVIGVALAYMANIWKIDYWKVMVIFFTSYYGALIIYGIGKLKSFV